MSSHPWRTANFLSNSQLPRKIQGPREIIKKVSIWELEHTCFLENVKGVLVMEKKCFLETWRKIFLKKNLSSWTATWTGHNVIFLDGYWTSHFILDKFESRRKLQNTYVHIFVWKNWYCRKKDWSLPKQISLLPLCGHSLLALALGPTGARSRKDRRQATLHYQVRCRSISWDCLVSPCFCLMDEGHRSWHLEIKKRCTFWTEQKEHITFSRRTCLPGQVWIRSFCQILHHGSG